MRVGDPPPGCDRVWTTTYSRRCRSPRPALSPRLCQAPATAARPPSLREIVRGHREQVASWVLEGLLGSDLPVPSSLAAAFSSVCSGARSVRPGQTHPLKRARPAARSCCCWARACNLRQHRRSPDAKQRVPGSRNATVNFQDHGVSCSSEAARRGPQVRRSERLSRLSKPVVRSSRSHGRFPAR